jgi:hypothetical protein
VTFVNACIHHSLSTPFTFMFRSCVDASSTVRPQGATKARMSFRSVSLPSLGTHRQKLDAHLGLEDGTRQRLEQQRLRLQSTYQREMDSLYMSVIKGVSCRTDKHTPSCKRTTSHPRRVRTHRGTPSQNPPRYRLA